VSETGPGGRETAEPGAVRQVLFDMDGLLLDTEIIYTRVTQQIVGRFGKVFDWSVKANMIGRGSGESSRYLVQALDLPITAEQYLAERDVLLREAFPACEPLPGVARLLRHLNRHGVPMAVATSSDRDLYDLKVRRHGELFSLFDTVVTGDDPEVTRAKPAPDIFLAAARRLCANPAECLVFEDAPSGLEAARAAGMAVVAVPDPNMDRDRYADAREVLTSLEEFRPERHGLPPYAD
jgi:pseudouridine-5'-monophosphatase